MKYKNTGSTIINIGKAILLPDETVEVTGEGYKNNAVLEFLVNTGRLAVVKDKTAEKPTEEKPTAEKTATAKKAAASKDKE